MIARVEVEYIYYAGCADCAEGWESDDDAHDEDAAQNWVDAHNAEYHGGKP